MTEYSYNRAIPSMGPCPCCNTLAIQGCGIYTHIEPDKDILSIRATCSVCRYSVVARIDRTKPTNVHILIKDLWNVRLQKDWSTYE